MRSKAILITECLQNDFVKPLGPQAPLPNCLHVGFFEARRLMGDTPAEGPVAGVMTWAYRETRANLLLVHIRDWHTRSDARQASHLHQFGEHCLADTPGADHVFPVPADRVNVAEDIHSLTLNDFQDTGLEAVLAPYAGREVPVGLMGVWTEAKIYFLAYELATRFPGLRLGICSALTASSSRADHFMALDQLRRILGVRVFDSVGAFVEFLGGGAAETPAADLASSQTVLEFIGPSRVLPVADEQLLRYVFRHCRSVQLKLLDGGFSGNVVAGARSFDRHGHQEAIHVVKIGAREAIARERTAFERIEQVLGNNAPRITEFADLGDRGIVKYRYASMAGEKATTFQKLYMSGAPLDKVRDVLGAVFEDQLGRLYGAATAESCSLLEYYQFAPRWAAHVRQRVETIQGQPEPGARIAVAGRACYNVCRFYEEDLGRVDPLQRQTVPFAFVHGDLNGANIIIDAHENVWIIDFFHTHRGHVLRDLIKLENDLLYIMTPVSDAAGLAQAQALTDRLAGVSDLAAELPDAPELSGEFSRAWAAIRQLRAFYPHLLQEDKGALSWQIGALRYAVHTLAFDESSSLQKQWALYAAGMYADAVRKTL